MDNGRGTFIVIEGTDGSGKETQFKRLTERLVNEGYDVATFDFPQYDQPSSYFVREYLNGQYGAAEDVGPYTGSLFYALDHYQAAPQIREALGQGKIVLANRYVGSSMAHQGTKFRHAEERRGYFIWLDNLEFEMLKSPRPTLSLVLRVPAETAQKLVDQKGPRDYTDKKRDIHEADLEHLEKAVTVYDDMCQLFPKDFWRVDCTREDQLLDIDTIHDILWQKLEPLLPEKRVTDKDSPAEVTEPSKTVVQNPYVTRQDDGTYEITEAGKQFLDEAVTDSEGNVYALTRKLNPVTVAAAMAHLCRRSDDLRITLLDDFAASDGKDTELLRRVVTAYGDDSVQQLTSLHMVVEQASNLLTKKLERGRLAAYLEQSTRYIYFDQKDKNGKYRYYTPDYLPAAAKERYTSYMDTIFDLYSGMVHALTGHLQNTSTVPKKKQDAAWHSAIKAQACDTVRPVLPVATASTVAIHASAQALENLIINLLSDDMPETRKTGEALLREARKVAPAFLERADKPEREGAMAAYRAQTREQVAKLAKKYLSGRHADPTPAVQLIEAWPRNELDLLPDMLYEHSDLPLKELRTTVQKWPYDKKIKVFEAYIGERLNRRHRPGRALEKIHYSWDLVCDYGIFRDLQRHRMVEALEWQELTPRYGYEVPKLIEDAGLTEQFETCFDLSLKLYSLLQEAGYPLEAQYATLLGHKMRWKVAYNAREAFHIHELRTSPQGHPGYRRLVQEMHDKVCEVHPLLGEAMKFVNKGEDPELTRLAAERYTQTKLQQLESNSEEQ